jgi:hypothetical protein
MSIVKDRRSAAAKAALSNTTTPTKQKEKAKREAGHTVAASKEVKAKQDKEAKAKQAERDARIAKWRDGNGVELAKGITVKHNGKVVGKVAYRHTHHDEKGKEIGMVGVALAGKGDALVIGGRTVRNRSFKAADLTAVPE